MDKSCLRTSLVILGAAYDDLSEIMNFANADLSRFTNLKSDKRLVADFSRIFEIKLLREVNGVLGKHLVELDGENIIIDSIDTSDIVRSIMSNKRHADLIKVNLEFHRKVMFSFVKHFPEFDDRMKALETLHEEIKIGKFKFLVNS